MKSFHVSVAIRVLEIYRVDAESQEEAADNWCWGELVHTSDEALDSEFLGVEEVL